MSRCQHISQCTLQASALHSQTGLPSHKQSLHPQDLHAAAQDLRNSARLGKLDRIAYLLAKHEKRLAALLVAPSPSTGKTALHLAAEEGHLGTVRALLEPRAPRGRCRRRSCRRPRRQQRSRRATSSSAACAACAAGTSSPVLQTARRVAEQFRLAPNAGPAVCTANRQAGGRGLASASDAGAGFGCNGVADGYAKAAGLEQDALGASSVQALH